MDYRKDSLLDLLGSEALRRGEFTLASGKKASYYLDCRRITLHPLGANLVAAGMLEIIQQADTLPAAVGGMAIGADPITASIVTPRGTTRFAVKRFHWFARSPKVTAPDSKWKVPSSLDRKS